MDENYLLELYEWIKSEDATYESRYSFDDFKIEMNNEGYASQMYDWISSVDATFKQREPFDVWSQKVKKKPENEMEEESNVSSANVASASNTPVQPTPTISGTSGQNNTSGLANTSENEEANVEDEQLQPTNVTINSGIDDSQPLPPQENAVEEDAPETAVNKISAAAGNVLKDADMEFERYVNSIDGDFIGKDETFIVPQLNYLFSDYGFQAVDNFGDNITVRTRDGKHSINIDNDAYFDSSDTKESERLKDFIRKHRAAEKRTNLTISGEVKEEKKFIDEEDLRDELKEFNRASEDFVNKQNDYIKRLTRFEQENKETAEYTQEDLKDPTKKAAYDEFLKEKSEYNKEKLELVQEQSGFERQGELIDQATTNYLSVVSSQGRNFEGYLSQALELPQSNAALATQGMTWLFSKLMPDSFFADQQYQDDVFLAEALSDEYAAELSEDDKKYLQGLKDNKRKDVSPKQAVEFSKLLREKKISQSQYDRLMRGQTKFGNQQAEENTIDRVAIKQRIGEELYDRINDRQMDRLKKEVLYGTDAVKGKFYNPFLGANSRGDAAVDLNQGIYDITSTATRKVLGDASSTEQWAQTERQGFWGGALMGTIESLPAVLGGGYGGILTEGVKGLAKAKLKQSIARGVKERAKAEAKKEAARDIFIEGGKKIISTPGLMNFTRRSANFYALTNKHLTNEMNANPYFDNVTEEDKTLRVKLPIGIAQSVLETVGFRNIMQSRGLAASLALRAMRKMPKTGATTKTFRQFIINDIKNTMAGKALKFGLTVGAGAAAEFETGFLQQISEMGVKEVYNQSEGIDVFNTPDSVGEWLSTAVYAGAQEAVGGFIMSVPSGLSNAYAKSDFKGLTDTEFGWFEAMSEDPNYTTLFVQKLKARMNSNGPDNISRKQAYEELQNFRQVQGLYRSTLANNNLLPNNLTMDQKKAALGLLKRRKEISDSMEGKNDYFKRRANKQLEVIDDALNKVFEMKVETTQPGVENQVQEEGEFFVTEDGTTVKVTTREDGQRDIMILDETGKPKGGTLISSENNISSQQAVENFVKQKVTQQSAPTTTIEQVTQNENVTQEEQGDIAEFFGENVQEGDVEVVVEDRLVMNPKGKKKKYSSSEQKIIDKLVSSARRALKATSKIAPNLKMIFHYSDDAYSKASGQPKNASKGVYKVGKGVIHINLALANQHTIFHEVFHAVFDEVLKTDSAMAAKAVSMIQTVRKSLDPNSKLAKEIDEFMERYRKAGIEEGIVQEEGLAYLMGEMAQAYESGKLTRPQKNAIIRFVESLARLFKINLPQGWTRSDQDIIDSLNALAGKMASGEVVEQSEVEGFKATDTELKQGKSRVEAEAKKAKEKMNIADVQKVAQQAMMNVFGYAPRTINQQWLRSQVKKLGPEYDIKQARINQAGQGGGFFITKNGKFFNPFKTNNKFQLEGPNKLTANTLVDLIVEARENNFRDAVIEDFLINVKGFKPSVVQDAMTVKANNLNTLPKSFRNLKNGIKSGIKLFNRVKKYKTRLINKNKKLKESDRLTQDQIVDKTIEYLENQPEYKNESDTYRKNGKVVNRRGMSAQQALMISEFQKEADLRPTQDLRTKLGNIRIMLAARKRAIKDIQKIKRQLRNFIRKSLSPDLYNKKQVTKLINDVAIADENNIERIYDNVLNLVTELNVKNLNQRIEEILNGNYEKKVGRGVIKGIKLAKQFTDRIKNIKNTLLDDNASPQSIEDLNSKLVERFKELDNIPKKTEEQMNEMQDIDIMINIMNSRMMSDNDINKVTALDDALVSLTDLVFRGRSELQDILDQDSKEYRKQTADLFYDITGIKLDPEAENFNELLDNLSKNRISKEDKTKLMGRTKKLLSNIYSFISNKLFTSHEALDGLMDKISSLPGDMFGGIAQELVTEKVDESMRVFKERRMAYETIIELKLREIYGKGWRKKSKENRKKQETGIRLNEKELAEAEAAYEKNPSGENLRALRYQQENGGSYMFLSQNEMYYLYNQFKDPANHKAFANMMGENYAEQMKKIEDLLTPETKAFADWQVNEWFPSLYETYNETYSKIYRTNMPWNRHYAGRLYRDGVEIEPLNLLGDGSVLNTSVGAASTIARVNNNKPIQVVDGTDALFTYMNDMEWFNAFAVNLRNIDKLFNNQHISKAIKDIYGKSVYSLIQQNIQKIANRGVRSTAMDGFINSMNNAFIYSRLGLSPLITIKQLTSIPTYANDIGVRNWLLYSMKNIAQVKKTWKEIQENSVYMQDRKNNSITKSIEAYSNEAMTEFIPNATKNFMLNFLLYNVKLGDRTAIMLGGMPNYMYYKAQYRKKNPKATEQEVIDYAVRKFEKDTKRTQQSGDLQDKDIFQTSNPIVRALNLFLTTPKQYLRKEIQGTRGLLRKLTAWDRNAGKGTIKENVRTILTYHFLMPTIFQFVALGFPGLLRPLRDEDEDDLLRAAILGNLNALFILGEAVNMTGDLLTGKPWAGDTRTVGILEIASGIVQKIDRGLRIKDQKKRDEAFLNVYMEVGSLTGLPLPTIKKLIENYTELDGRDGKDLLRILGFSKYVVDGPQSKKASKNPKKRKKKSENSRFNKNKDRFKKREKSNRGTDRNRINRSI